MINQDAYFNNLEAARNLLAQNTPVETVSQQTGIPRETLLNILQSDISQRPTVATPPTGMGLSSLSGQLNTDISSIMPNLGTDIGDYLVDELGFDPMMMVEPDIDTDFDIQQTTPKQDVNRANAQLMIDDPSQAEEVLAAQKILSGQSDEDAIDVYKRALADYAGIDYKNLISLPDKDFAIMMAGLKLAEAGTKGENWSTALTQAVTTGLAQYAKEKKDYTKAINSIDLQRAMQKDKQVMDFIGKQIDADIKLQNEMLTGTRKEYLVTLPGGDTPTIMQLTSPQVGLYQAKFGVGSIKEYDSDSMGALSNYTITYSNGSTSKRPMTNAMAAQYAQMLDDGKIAGFVKSGVEGADDEFQVMVRDKGARKDTPYKYQFVGQSALNTLLNDTTKEVKVLPKPGTSYEVINLETDQLERVPADQYFKNPDRYKLKGGLTASISNGDQTIMIGSDGSGFSGLNDKQAGQEVEKIATQFRSRQYLTDTILQTAENLEELVMGMDNPDLAFNNVAGLGLEFGRKVIATVTALGKTFESSYGTNAQGDRIEKYKYQIGDKPVSYTDFKNTMLNSKGFQELEKSGLGQYIIRSAPDRARAQAALFNIALSGAASAGGDPSPDLRAISDKDMELFMKLVGANATNAEDFLAVINDFKRDTINRELFFYDSATTLPIKRAMRVKNEETGLYEDKVIDLFQERGLYNQADKRREVLKEKLNIITTPRKLGTDSAVSSRTITSLKLNPLQLSTGESISPVESTGYPLPGVNDATYEDLVGYAASLSPKDARQFNQNLKTYFARTRNPQGFTIYLNFYKNAGIQ